MAAEVGSKLRIPKEPLFLQKVYVILNGQVLGVSLAIPVSTSCWAHLAETILPSLNWSPYVDIFCQLLMLHTQVPEIGQKKIRDSVKISMAVKWCINYNLAREGKKPQLLSFFHTETIL